MSAYGHQMEREYSAENLSARAGSERESNYVMESGFYMTSFAATIFIASLATAGVLLIALLITLTVMLQSCERKSAGLIETPKLDYEFETCKAFALHSELNNGEAFQFPGFCKTLGARYIEEGRYYRDLNLTVSVLEYYLQRVDPREVGFNVFLLDIDDVLSLNPQLANRPPQRDEKFARHLKHEITLRIFTELRDRRLSVALISRKPERWRNVTTENLLSAEFRDWSSLIMRSEDEVHIPSYEYFSRSRAILQNKGFHSVNTISSRFDALTGQCSGCLAFKLPNPFYYTLESQNESTDYTPVYNIVS